MYCQYKNYGLTFIFRNELYSALFLRCPQFVVFKQPFSMPSATQKPHIHVSSINSI